MPWKSSKAVKIIPSILFAVNFVNSLKDMNVFVELALEQLTSVGHVWTLASVETGEPHKGRRTTFNISFFPSRLQLELS